MPDDQQHIIALYRVMPGAPQPYADANGPLWGEVEGNEHWQFCAAIVRMAIGAAQAYSR